MDRGWYPPVRILCYRWAYAYPPLIDLCRCSRRSITSPNFDPVAAPPVTSTLQDPYRIAEGVDPFLLAVHGLRLGVQVTGVTWVVLTMSTGPKKRLERIDIPPLTNPNQRQSFAPTSPSSSMVSSTSNLNLGISTVDIKYGDRTDQVTSAPSNSVVNVVHTDRFKKFFPSLLEISQSGDDRSKSAHLDFGDGLIIKKGLSSRLESSIRPGDSIAWFPRDQVKPGVISHNDDLSWTQVKKTLAPATVLVMNKDVGTISVFSDVAGIYAKQVLDGDEDASHEGLYFPAGEGQHTQISTDGLRVSSFDTEGKMPYFVGSVGAVLTKDTDWNAVA